MTGKNDVKIIHSANGVTSTNMIKCRSLDSNFLKQVHPMYSLSYSKEKYCSANDNKIQCS